MATPQGDGSIILTTAIDQSGLKKGIGSIKSMAKTATKAFLAVGAAAATATIAIAKASVDAFAEYEQLVGGVETLFKGSSKKLIEYANEAYRTAGVSANQYMSIVTSFSASLLQSLGGDTEKAADIANQALIDMSDNANKMGTSMEAIQNAYQGFAKQNYTMLDNLKLGYGGTKTEMERLLRDAQALTGVKYDISNLADVYTAIHVIQENLGIAGTTALEAEKTISGSAKTMKASWQNVLTAISGGGDLDRAIENLVNSISNYFENIVPVIERALAGIGTLIEKVAPMLVQTVAKSLIKAIPELLNAVYQMIIGLAKGIYEGIKALFTGGSASATAEIKTSIGDIANTTADASIRMEELGDATEKAGKQAKKALAPFDELQIISSGTGDEDFLPEVSVSDIGVADVTTSVLEETKNEVGGFTSILQEQFAKIAEIAKKVWNSSPIQAFVTAAQTILQTLWNFVTPMWDNIKNNAVLTWQDIELDLQTTVQNLTALWTQFWNDFNSAVQVWGPPIIAGISKLFNSIWQTAIYPYVKLITTAWEDFTAILLRLWNKYGEPLTKNIGEFVKKTIDLFQSIYDNILEPIIIPLLEELSWLWEKHISKMVYALGDFIMTLINGALKIYNKFIAPLVEFLLEVLAPAWSSISSLIVGVAGTIIGAISDLITGLLEMLKGIVDFITGVFAGDWEQAWEGVKEIFKGVFDALVGIAKAPINLIIDAINSLISGLNKVSFDLPDWDILGDWGGKTFGINIPKIPKLAQGTVVPPNKEFMTILGDNTKEHEIVSPISTMKQAVTEAMLEMGGSFGGRNTEVILEIDGREFGRAVVEQGNRENRRIGTRLVIA